MAGMDLGKQIGPLPLGAWIAVVAGGLGIALWSKNQNSGSNDPEIVEDTSGDAGVGTGGSGQWVDTNPPPATGTITYDTNEAWGQAAINYLIAQGYPTALATNAITKGLSGGVDINGTKMSIQEWALWSLALAKFGSPPQPVTVVPPTSTPGPVTPTPDPVTPTPTTPKPGGNKVPAHWVEIAKRGDSISKIAARHNKGWQETWNFNLKYRSKATAAIMKARGPNLIYAGTQIWVPK